MAISLYDVTVASFLQVLGGVAGFLEKGLAHSHAKGLSLPELLDTRLYPDMLPFRFQIIAVAHHSANAIEGVKAGVFRPPTGPMNQDYAGLQAVIADARARLEKLSRDEVETLQGKDVVFQLGDFKLPFTAENFLMSFSMPNLHFHATTAYDILRLKGAPLGKRDYMGAMRLKT
ncbi:MAG TPA: DUF1993 domain-containing protein [Myxococcota bacterium]|nr:DUF1993 domain-containing protein [Myxococcota bacterium]